MPRPGEPLADFQTRIQCALTTVAAVHGGQTCVVVVTHGGGMRAVLHLLNDGRLPLADGHAAPPVVPIVNASILHLSVAADQSAGLRWSLHAVNDAAHLTETTPDFDAG
jgi:broad specificity phosphatase PhoE